MDNSADYNSLLKLTNTAVLKKFLHQCVDELIGKEHENFNNSMDDIEWSKEEHKVARNYVQTLYKKHVFEDEFSLQLKDLSSSHVEEIETCFNIRKKDIHRAVVKEQLLKSNIPLVENIDWKIKWIIGTSKLSSLSEPLVVVDLNCVCKENNNNVTNSDSLRINAKNCDNLVNFEMNLTQIDNLIRELEQVKLNFNN